MDALAVLELISQGESTLVQFKQQINDVHSISKEIVAFANTKGGIIIVGVEDKTGGLRGLSYVEIEKYNGLLSDAANNNVKPTVNIETEQIKIDDKIVIIATIKEGLNKPYKDKKGVTWVKSASNKRRVTSNEEEARFLQEGGYLTADQQEIKGSSYSNINLNLLKYYLIKSNIFDFESFINKLGKGSKLKPNDLQSNEIDFFLQKIDFTDTSKKFLTNLGILSNDKLSLAGLLLFSDDVQRFKSLFTIDCVSFPQNDTNALTYLDTENLSGNYYDIFQKTMFFLERNLKKIPFGEGFNTPYQYEIPLEALRELLVNALVHRNYYINSTIKVFIFPNRIEIISPGVLPNSLTIEKVKAGISNARNPNLHSLAKFILPYKGYGTGIKRAIRLYPDIEFENDTDRELFIVKIKRK